MKSCRLTKEDYAEVKNLVGMRKAAEFYGYPVDRQGRCLCPFHRDRHPSMKIYPHDRGYYCFACGEGGDVVTFVSRLYNLKNEEAARKLIGDFSLPIKTGLRRVCRRAPQALPKPALRGGAGTGIPAFCGSHAGIIKSGIPDRVCGRMPAGLL